MVKAKTIKPKTIYFSQGSDVPNSHLPALLYRNLVDPAVKDKAAVFRKKFSASNWEGIWMDTIYDYMHFHSNAHEVLGIAEGKVTVKLGGENGHMFHLKAGDMLVLPAGVGHRRITDNDEGLKVISAYPQGQSHFDMKRKGKARPNVPLPNSDPFYGNEGPLTEIWGTFQPI